jgi:hypothetical protein
LCDSLICGPFMELAGPEPATSWVRFRCTAFPPVVMRRRLRQPCGASSRAVATVCHSLPRLLDQDLTTRTPFTAAREHGVSQKRRA